jgi:hypothetical protein
VAVQPLSAQLSHRARDVRRKIPVASLDLHWASLPLNAWPFDSNVIFWMCSSARSLPPCSVKPDLVAAISHKQFASPALDARSLLWNQPAKRTRDSDAIAVFLLRLFEFLG